MGRTHPEQVGCSSALGRSEPTRSRCDGARDGSRRSSRGEESLEQRLLSSLEPSQLTIPLVVDLDGNLVGTDLLIESIVALVKARSRYAFALPLWLLKGRVALKQDIARRISLDACLVPYRSELVEYIEAQRSQGRTVQSH